ncbi:MAG: hypothetical protein Q7R45_13640, partial [Sulfuricaulis sp.]|nr:hypothetical protein [Sulfuricaulis sp.]
VWPCYTAPGARRKMIRVTPLSRHDGAELDMTRFDKPRKPDDEFEQLTGRIKKAFSEIPPQKGMALIDEAVRAARKKRTRKFS